MSPVHTKRIALDSGGSGSLSGLAPMFYVGVDGATAVQSEGEDYGTANLTPATAKFMEGDVQVSGGSANGEAVIFLIDG